MGLVFSRFNVQHIKQGTGGLSYSSGFCYALIEALRVKYSLEMEANVVSFLRRVIYVQVSSHNNVCVTLFTNYIDNLVASSKKAF